MTAHNHSWIKVTDEEKIVHRKYFPERVLSVRSLQLNNDIDTLHEWVNRGYALRFWQMQGPKENLYEVYQNLLAHPCAQPFIVLWDDRRVALVDLYMIKADELGSLIPHGENDCGIHLLMLPPEDSARNLAAQTLITFFEYYFSFRQAGDLYGEPDSQNLAANAVAKKAGFRLLQPLQMKSKLANLYRIRREDFLPLAFLL